MPFFGAAPVHGYLNVAVESCNGDLILGVQVLHEEIQTIEEKRPRTLHAAAVIDQEKDAVTTGNRGEILNSLENTIFIDAEVIPAKIRDRLFIAVIYADVHRNERGIDLKPELVVGALCQSPDGANGENQTEPYGTHTVPMTAAFQIEGG